MFLYCSILEKMMRIVTVVQVLLFFTVSSSTHLDLDCQSGSCEASVSDDISLIQGLLEPDLIVRMPKKDTKADAKKDTTTTAKATTTQSYAVKGNEVKLNAAGDLPAFLSAIQLDVGLFVFFVCVFVILQKHYPTMYAWRWFDGDSYNEEKLKEEQGYFVWMKKAWSTPVLKLDKIRLENKLGLTLAPSVEETSGLDAAMLLKFNDLALELMVAIGVPALVIGAPMFAFAGGGMAKDDRLSWQGIGNVIYNNTEMTGEPMDPQFAAKLGSVQWIYWVVAAAVWVVILYVMHRMKVYQQLFLQARMAWLLRMPEPRCTTVMVEGIEEGYNTNQKLKEYFENLFGSNSVQSAFVVVNSGYLSSNIRSYNTKKLQIEGIQNNMDETKSDKLAELEKELDTLKTLIASEQEAVIGDPTKCTTNGFVTFRERRDAERALGVRLHEDHDTWVLDTPPAPNDVRYSDFECSDEVRTTQQLLGYAGIAALFLCFMPIVIGIGNLSTTIEETPFILNFLESTGMKSTVDGTLQTIGLTIMMAMLPTFLAWIFQAFYTLKANRWEQIHIQTYYFWFLVLFVLLTTAVGANLSATLKALATSPFSVFSLLAEMMPVTTHFYLNYVVLQPVTHAMNLTRYIQLIKFLSLKRVCDTEERARELSEPEDQDYYGIGSRSARFTIMLLIGLVFGTICPLMNVVTFYNFICCRFIYGYLIPYQEKPKDDMGGVHWCMQLHHVQICLAIYLIMMTGILAERCESIGPAVISAISFLWWILAYRRFTRSMQWEKLPYTKMFKEGGGIKESYQQPRADDKTYEQPQLVWTPAKV
mmetsp:Transcript_115260/g.181397  ORF Transcript_115260/g.181397 Transcript_115260/m.181397 type:complete len:815 (-) Transcript_115260:383-2827(-)